MTCDREQQLDNRAQLDRFLAGVEMQAYRVAQYGLGNRDDALDAVQDAMMQLARRYADRSAEEWKPLFYRILGNRVRDTQRRRTVRRRLMAWLPVHTEQRNDDPVAAMPDPGARRPEEHVALDDAMDALDKAILDLAPRQQQALLLRMVEGMDVAGAALAMGCSQGSVKTHYSRAIHALRARLGEHWP